VYAELVILLDAECLVHSRSGFSEVSHRIMISNEQTHERCGMQFDQCNDQAVTGAVQVLEWSQHQHQYQDHVDEKMNPWSSWVPVV